MRNARGTRRFTNEHRKELRKLGVRAEQLEAFERELDICGRWLTPLPALNDVRDEFNALTKALTAAHGACTRMLESNPLISPARAEVHLRVATAYAQTDGKDYPIRHLTQVLLDDLALIDRARSTLGNKQRRFFAASFFSVARIHEALLEGWASAHESLDGNQPDIVDLTAMPRFPHSPSTTGAFARIVGIFYEVLGRGDPDRAIRNYRAWCRRRDEKQRTELGIFLDKPVRPLRRLKP